MIRFIERTRLATLSMAVSVAACGWLGGDSPLTSNDTLLRYVPADTPYVVAAIEPLPDELMDRFSDYAMSAGGLVQAVLQASIEDMNRAATFGGPDAFFEEPAVDPEVIEILMELSAPETLIATGINRDSRSVLYGFGLLPVFRITLAQGHEFERILDRIETLLELNAELTVETARIQDRSYRRIDAGDARFIVALLDDELVLSVVPTGFGDAELTAVLGLIPPEQTIADSGRLAEIADDYGFTSHLVSLLDIERIAGTFVDDAPRATDAALLRLAGYDLDGVPPVCRDEIRAAAAVVPSLVGGYTRLDSRAMEGNFVVHLREDIAAGLARIASPIQGLGAASDAMISFGLALDVARARAFLAERIDAVEADPYECEAFAGLQESLAEARMVLNQPLPLPVDDLKGISVTLDVGDIDLSSPNGMPTEVELTALVATDDVAGTIATLSALDPAIAALGLQADGRIVELEGPNAFADPEFTPFGAAFIAATESSIGVALGRDGEALLDRLMDSPYSDPSTFLSMSMDLARYYGLAAELLTSPGFAGDPAALAVATSMSELIESIQSIYSRETLEVRFTERGIAMPVRFELADER